MAYNIRIPKRENRKGSRKGSKSRSSSRTRTLTPKLGRLNRETVSVLIAPPLAVHDEVEEQKALKIAAEKRARAEFIRAR
jgi:hypothetical protein